MVRPKLLCALVAVVACAPSAAVADEVEWNGLSCGMATTNDPSGILNQDPNARFGWVTLGPVHAADVVGPAPHGVPAEIEIHCWVQVNIAPYGGHAPIPTAHCHESGIGTAQGACQVAFSAGPTDNVYLCTEIRFRHAGMTEVYQHDAANPNVQCPVASSLETGQHFVRPDAIPPATTA